MTRRGRIVTFGSCAGLVLAGVAGAVIFNGTLGQVLALTLISLGLVLGTGLVFLEVGLSEDRERVREEMRRATSPKPPPARPRRRLDRMRGRPRRLP